MPHPHADLFLVRWLWHGRRAWLPGDWPVGLINAIVAQAERDLEATCPWWCTVLANGRGVQGGLN